MGLLLQQAEPAQSNVQEQGNDDKTEEMVLLPKTADECTNLGYEVNTETNECLVALEQTDNGDDTVEEEPPAIEEPKTYTYTSSKLGKALKSGAHQITITKIESGKPSGEPKNITENRYKYIRVYFTLKNNGTAQSLYGFEAFKLQDSNGKIFNSRVDIGLDEFGHATLAAGGTEKSFTIFYSDTTSGYILWTPPNGEDSSAEIKIDFKRKD